MHDATPQTLTIQDALQLAIREHRNGNVQQAERLYRAILEKEPDNADAAHNLGVLAMQHDHIQAALPLLQTALNARPQQVQFWKSAIKALYEVGEYAKCVEISTRYLSLNPADAEATAELARTQLMLMDENAQTVPENIWQILERAQALQPESPAVLRNLARARLRSKQLNPNLTPDPLKIRRENRSAIPGIWQKTAVLQQWGRIVTECFRWTKTSLSAKCSNCCSRSKLWDAHSVSSSSTKRIARLPVSSNGNESRVLSSVPC